MASAVERVPRFEWRSKIMPATKGANNSGWINQWYPPAAAVNTIALFLKTMLEQTGAPPLQHMGESIDRHYRDYLDR